MAACLPEDILYLVCSELSEQDDFPTLFSCALAGKQLAPSALTGLYRTHNRSPVVGGNEALPIAQQELVVQKWSILWRSIILSSMQKTLYPYCRYIKVLDLRDLSYLLEDDKFKGRILLNFFSGCLSKFYLQMTTPSKRAVMTVMLRRLDINLIVVEIGGAVIDQAPSLEQLFGSASSPPLYKWAPKLPRLRRLELWDGETLAMTEVQQAIHAHCPYFSALSIYVWANERSDRLLAAFLNGLPHPVLTFFRVISTSNVAIETFLALSKHGPSLKELRLTELSAEALPALAYLKGCTSLETLELIDKYGTVDLEATHNDVFMEIITWLSTCTQLKRLILSRFVSGPAMLMPVLLSDKIRLRKLELNGYIVKDHREFHRALAHQDDLQSLFLKGDSDGVVRDDIDVLIDSLIHLRHLKELRLGGVSDFFRDENILAIMQNLVELEELYVGGFGITDAVLNRSAGRLQNLRSISFMGMTSFTTDGLLEFVSQLGPSNHGLVISVDLASVEGRLSEEEQFLIRDALASKVGGRFEYQLWRDPDISEYEGSDSD